jgi:hypothetical protein
MNLTCHRGALSFESVLLLLHESPMLPCIWSIDANLANTKDASYLQGNCFFFNVSQGSRPWCRRVPAWENHFRMPGTNHSRTSRFPTLKLAWHVPICDLLWPRVIKHSPSLDLTQESFKTSAHKVQQFRQHKFPNHTASINECLFDEPNCVSMHSLLRASSWYYILVSCGATQSVEVIYIKKGNMLIFQDTQLSIRI